MTGLKLLTEGCNYYCAGIAVGGYLTLLQNQYTTQSIRFGDFFSLQFLETFKVNVYALSRSWNIFIGYKGGTRVLVKLRFKHGRPSLSKTS